MSIEEFLLNNLSGSFSRNRYRKRGDTSFPVKLYYSSLIALARMDMNRGGTALGAKP